MELNILLSRWLSQCILRVTNEEIKLKFRELVGSPVAPRRAAFVIRGEEAFLPGDAVTRA